MRIYFILRFLLPEKIYRQNKLDLFQWLTLSEGDIASIVENCIK